MFSVKDVIKRDLRNKGIYLHHWQTIAEDRQPGEPVSMAVLLLISKRAGLTSRSSERGLCW